MHLPAERRVFRSYFSQIFQLFRRFFLILNKIMNVIIIRLAVFFNLVCLGAFFERKNAQIYVQKLIGKRFWIFSDLKINPFKFGTTLLLVQATTTTNIIHKLSLSASSDHHHYRSKENVSNWGFVKAFIAATAISWHFQRMCLQLNTLGRSLQKRVAQHTLC